MANPTEMEQAERIAKLLKDNGFEPEEVIGSLKQIRLNEWETTIAGSDGPETVTNRGVSVVLNAEKTGPDGVPIELRQASPVEVNIRTPRRLPPRRPTDGKWAILFPDAQRPSVDHAAVDVGHQILADLEAEHGVDDIIHLGDDLDLPDFSTHRSAPDVLGKVNDAIQDQYECLAIEKALAPKAKRRWLAGNHEQRLINWLVDNAPQLIGLQRANEKNKPVISVPYLCRLDELGVEYVDPYPEGEIWLNEHLRCIHGDTVKPGKGATGAFYLQQGHMSTIFGHTHRSELVYTTRHTPRGPRTYLAGSPGCLCRVDYTVPSSKSGITDEGKQGGTRTEDWQQGIWVVWYQPKGRQLYSVEHVAIWGGWAQWRGREYVARRDVDGNVWPNAA